MKLRAIVNSEKGIITYKDDKSFSHQSSIGSRKSLSLITVCTESNYIVKFDWNYGHPIIDYLVSKTEQTIDTMEDYFRSNLKDVMRMPLQIIGDARSLFPEIESPNGIISWTETYGMLVYNATALMDSGDWNFNGGVVEMLNETRFMANQFEKEFKDYHWGEEGFPLDWDEQVYAFILEQNKKYL